MFNCDHTNNTIYTFHNELCSECDNVNYVGLCPAQKMNSSLTCGVSSDMWVQLFVSKIVDIPVQKPDLEGICSVNTCVRFISQRVVKTPTVTGYTNAAGVFVPGSTIDNAEGTRLTGRKLILEGIIEQKVIYTSLSADQALHSAEFRLPFSTFIIIDENTPLSRKFQISSILEDVFACALSERSIFTNNTLFIKVVPVC